MRPSPAQPSSLSIAVIVAEDEPLIRMMAVDALMEEGFCVLEAQHAEEALAILNSQATDVHALFTDIHMPGPTDGLRLAHQVRGRWPWIALILASGNLKPEADEMPEGSRFLSKPYDPGEVSTHIRELVGGRGDAACPSARDHR